MILYFTGTGNSKYVASMLSSKLNDELVSLNDVIKYNKEHTFESLKPFVVVAPIYAWRLPKVIEDLLREAKFKGNKNIYYIATMGGNSGICDKTCELLSRYNSMNYMGFRGVLMPDQYILMYDVPNDNTIKQIISNAKIEIEQIADDIKQGKTLYKTDKTLFAAFMSKSVNKQFYKHYVTDKDFYISNECTSCGLCEKVCPVNNITLTNGKPSFNHKCISCLSCIHHCPTKALNAKGKTEKKRRYICEEYKD